MKTREKNIQNSNIAEVRTMALSTKELVQALLGWDDLQYGNFQMEQGELYLKKLIGPDVYGIDFLMQSPTFWKWWINLWNKRDQDFINELVNTDQEECIEVYRFTHSPYRLTSKPHKAILEESYRQMVGDAFDQYHRKEDKR
jgi:hypothetical protein